MKRSAYPRRIEERRRGRQLATEIVAAVENAGTRFVLITSVSRGDGKSHLAQTLRRELAMIATGRFVVLDWHDLAGLDPGHFPPDQTIIVDGPAMLEGEEIFSLPPPWLEAFDGSLVVVMKRVTTKEDLLDLFSWLTAAGCPPIGTIWNEKAFPPLGTVLGRFRDWLADLFDRRRPAAGHVHVGDDREADARTVQLATIIARATSTQQRVTLPPEGDAAASPATDQAADKAQPPADRPEEWQAAGSRWIPPWVNRDAIRPGSVPPSPEDPQQPEQDRT